MKSSAARGKLSFLTHKVAIDRIVHTAKKFGVRNGRRFWDYTAFSHVIVGYRAYWTACNYIEKNKIESELGKAARKMVEEFEQAVRPAKKFCCSIDEVFQSTA